MDQLILDALLFLFGVSSLTTDMVELMSGIIEITKDTLEVLMASTVFAYFIALAYGLLIIYFMIDLLGHAQKELLNTDYIVNGFIKLALIATLLLFAPDITLKLCDFGVDFFSDVQTYMNESNKYKLAIYGEWGTQENVTNWISDGAEAVANSFGADTVDFGGDMDFHNGLWLFEPGGDYQTNWHSGDCIDGNNFLSPNGFTGLTDPFKVISGYNCQSYTHDAYDILTYINPFSAGDDPNTCYHRIDKMFGDGNVYGNSITGSISHLGILFCVCFLNLFLIVIRIACVFCIAKIAIGLLINGLMMPIGIAHFTHKGEEAAGVKYLKKFLAKCLSFSLVLVCIYVFNVFEEKHLMRMWFSDEPLFTIHGIYRANDLGSYFTGTGISDDHTLVLLINGRSLSFDTATRLSDIFRFDVMLYSLIPAAALFSALMNVEKLSNDILGVN